MPPNIPLPPGWSLRLAGPQDSSAVAAHIARIYEEFGLTFDLDFEDDLIDVADTYKHGAFWIVEGDGGRIHATAAVLPNGGSRLFKRLYVAPIARRSGVGRALLEAAQGWGDFSRTELWSDVRFQNAHRLYRSMGYAAGPTRVLDDPDRSVERSFWRVGQAPPSSSLLPSGEGARVLPGG